MRYIKLFNESNNQDEQKITHKQIKSVLIDDRFKEEEFYKKISRSEFQKLYKRNMKFTKDEIDTVEDLIYYSTTGAHLVNSLGGEKASYFLKDADIPLYMINTSNSNILIIISPSRKSHAEIYDPKYDAETRYTKYLTTIIKLSNDYYLVEDISIEDNRNTITMKDVDNWDDITKNNNNHYLSLIIHRIYKGAKVSKSLNYRNYYLLDQFSAVEEFIIRKDIV